MSDKHITCVQCGTGFIFSAAEQERFLYRGFAVPRRCPECRNRKHKAFNNDRNWGGKDRRKAERRGGNSARFHTNAYDD